MTNFDDMRLAVEAASGGKNTVILDDKGLPSIMVRIPKMYISDLITDGAATVHPAFTVNDVTKEEVYISKYINIIKDSRAYSLPAQDPTVYTTFDNSLNACKNKGDGWGLTPFALWSAIALWCRKNGTMPHGNNSYGKDSAHPHERAVETANENNPSAAGTRTTRTATGTGPQSWNHDNTPFGIADMNGNVWEWCAGMRLEMGVLNMIPNADCMLRDCDMSVNSDEWRIISKDGEYLSRGDTNSIALHWDSASSIWHWSTEDIPSVDTQSHNCGFNKVVANKSGDISEKGIAFLKTMALMPEEASGDYGGDLLWAINGEAERLPLRGGSYGSGANAGVFSLGLDDPRSYSGVHIGFRSAYYGAL